MEAIIKIQIPNFLEFIFEYSGRLLVTTEALILISIHEILKREYKATLITTNKKCMSYRPSDLPSISRHLSENQNSPTKQNYEDLVNCSICYEPFDSVNQLKLPKILPCQHTYCVQCIKNLLHISQDNKKFCCPQCQYKVENLLDPTDLPTSRIVLSLIEKDSLNYAGYAACPSCRQIRNLEVCFECNLPLCGNCIGKHFEVWKNDVTQNCLNSESTLEDYKSKLDQVGNLITQNFDNVQNVRDEIENAFHLLVERLNQEKDVLLKSLNQVKDENAKYVNLRKDLVSLITNFKTFRESNENFEKKLMNSKMRKLQVYLEQVPKLQTEYNSLAGSNFKVLEKFEKRPIPDLEHKLSGNLIIKEFTFELPRNPSQINRPQPPLRTPPSAPILPSPASINRFPPPPPTKQDSYKDVVRNVASAPSMESLRPIATDQDVLGRWILVSHIKPQSEMSINTQPAYLTSYQNLLFSMDQSSFITIFEKVYSLELKLKNSLRLNVPNIKCISVNSEYLAVGYNNLKKEQLKGALKGMNSSGIFLFNRQQHIVCSVHDKTIELGKNESFKCISGLAMNEKYLYALDRELRQLFKFDIKTGQLEKRVNFSNGDLGHVSLNETFLTVTDVQNSVLCLIDAESLTQIKMVSLKTIDQVQGQLINHTSPDNFIFVRNSERQVSILDSNLEQVACFNEIQAKIMSICLISFQSSQMLVIGGSNDKNQFKLFGYTI
ncbi:unnamed protein product [Brachionus calyciflorus]|uniref:RING-type domain-containing protein n=1 Tax=Brachionus calyciflorus TaxID=104777 RepID=A0A813XR50_9BILA|nr:unnamed protein product [Brachionus calyciflorus]